MNDWAEQILTLQRDFACDLREFIEYELKLPAAADSETVLVNYSTLCGQKSEILLLQMLYIVKIKYKGVKIKWL